MALIVCNSFYRQIIKDFEDNNNNNNNNNKINNNNNNRLLFVIQLEISLRRSPSCVREDRCLL